VSSEDGRVRIANRIFELWIGDYFISKDARRQDRKEVAGVFKDDVVKDGRFDMELCLRGFARHYRRIFTKKDAPFLERHGRLVFLSFLTPLINGEGYYYIESETSDALRMDLVVSYNREEFILELKLWRGEKAHKTGCEQLANYLRCRGARQGYLLSFDFRGESRRKPKEEWLTLRPDPAAPLPRATGGKSPSGENKEGGSGELRIFDVIL
jgi:hypothetical protein